MKHHKTEKFIQLVVSCLHNLSDLMALDHHTAQRVDDEANEYLMIVVDKQENQPEKFFVLFNFSSFYCHRIGFEYQIIYRIGNDKFHLLKQARAHVSICIKLHRSTHNIIQQVTESRQI